MMSAITFSNFYKICNFPRTAILGKLTNTTVYYRTEFITQKGSHLTFVQSFVTELMALDISDNM